MSPRDEFLVGRLEGAPSDDIGWHFGEPMAGNKNNIRCKLCDKVIKGGITRLKQHIAHVKGQLARCARVTTLVQQSMMKLLMDAKAKKKKRLQKKKRRI